MPSLHYQRTSKKRKPSMMENRALTLTTESPKDGGYRSIDKTHNDSYHHQNEQENIGVTVNTVTVTDERREIVASSSPEQSGPVVQQKMSAKGKLLLALCTSALFFTSIAYSLLGPFYTIEAERKGMSMFLVGVVFGIFELVIVLTSPIFGSYLTTLGVKFVFLSGIFVGGTCNVLFGTLIFCPDGTPFAVISILCRSVEAIGFSAYSTAAFAIVSCHNPSHVGFAIGILETGIGAGFIVGPVLGGGFYELGGFGLPFYAVGGLVLLNGIIMSAVLPSTGGDTKDKRNDSIFTLLRSPEVVVAIGSTMTAMFGITAFNSLLAQDVAAFGLSPLFLGLLFVAQSGMFTLFSPVWGYITDKINYIHVPLIIGGHLASAVGYFLLGPSVLFPFIPFNLWTVGIGQVLFGIAFGCIFVSSMKYMTIGAFRLKLTDSIDTYALVSGLFMATYNIGGFLGPLVSGAVAQTFNPHTAFTLVALINICIMLLDIAYYVLLFRRRKNI